MQILYRGQEHFAPVLAIIPAFYIFGVLFTTFMPLEL
jgi:hypothetical protein